VEQLRDVRNIAGIPGNPQSPRTQELQEGRMKRRHEFYLEEEVSERLATVAAKPGSSKTAIMTGALKAYFDRRAGTELDGRFKARLDKLSVQLGRIGATSRSWRRRWLSLPDFSSWSLLLLRIPIAQRGDWLKSASSYLSNRSPNGHGLVEDVLLLTSPAETNYEL
jgi:hypothetical protein